MKAGETSRSFWQRPPALLGLLGLIAAAFAVYPIVVPSGNPDLRTLPEAAPEAGGQPQKITRDLAKGPLAAFVVKPTRPPVADLAFSDESGAAKLLSNWRGKVVLVNLWATWCGPCRKEMPALARLQSKLGGADFEVVAISIDRKGAPASAAFLAEAGATALKLYIDPSTKSLGAVQAIGLPATLLIDREGREIGRLLGPAEWDSPEAEKLVSAAIAERDSTPK